MNKETLIGEIEQAEPTKFLFVKKNHSADFKSSDGSEAEYVIERRDQSKFFDKISKPQDYLTWQLLKSHLSIQTKLVHTTQKEMCEKVKMRPATFSESLKRLQEKGMVRQYQSTVDCGRGLVLNPYFLTIGSHYKMWSVWNEAGDQIKQKRSVAEWEAKKAAEDALYADLVLSAQGYIDDGMDIEDAANAVTLDEEEFCAVMSRLHQI